MKTRNLFLVAVIALFAMSCNSKGQTEKQEISETTVATNTVDASITNVYYFHGKQRCKTCIAIENVAKNVIAENYKDNPNVKYVEVNIDEARNKEIVEKYEIAFSSLLIAKGDKSIDLTEQAFANAVNSPEVLENLIKEEVNKNI